MPLDSKMTHEFQAPWWSIQVARGWFSEQEDGCATFWREDGVGALQISAHSHGSGIVPENDLDIFTQGEFPDGAALELVRCGEFEGVGVDFVKDGKFWRKRWVHKGGLLVYVTYNSDSQDQSVETEAVNEMLTSLKSRSPAA
jgi:hypothetical protein